MCVIYTFSYRFSYFINNLETNHILLFFLGGEGGQVSMNVFLFVHQKKSKRKCHVHHILIIIK